MSTLKNVQITITNIFLSRKNEILRNFKKNESLISDKVLCFRNINMVVKHYFSTCGIMVRCTLWYTYKISTLMVHWYISVSYTHLDVYKRQVQCISVWSYVLSGLCRIYCNLNNLAYIHRVAVSYTHLDVYKRQVRELSDSTS